MRKYYVAYRSRGEAQEVLEERLNLTVAALRKAGIDAYCNFFDQDEYAKQHLTYRQIMDKAFVWIDDSDGLFALVASNDKSEGQLVEVGYAFAKDKHIIAAVQQDATTLIEDLANETIRWRDLADLQTQLESLE